MKEFKYQPTTEGFTGVVTLKMLTFKERISAAQELGIGVTKDGSVDVQDGLGVALKMLDKLKEQVVTVDVKYGENAFKSLDDLEYFSEGNELIQELGKVMMNGMSLGKA